MRAAHVTLLIEPSMVAGRLVLCDRFALSTFIYQGVARGLDLDLVGEITRIATGGLGGIMAEVSRGHRPQTARARLSREPM